MSAAPEPIADPACRSLAELIRQHARARPDRNAWLQDDARPSYAGLDSLMDCIAASLRRDGLQPGDAIAICVGKTQRLASLAFLDGLPRSVFRQGAEARAA